MVRAVHRRADELGGRLGGLVRGVPGAGVAVVRVLLGQRGGLGVALALTTGALAILHGLDRHPSRLLEASVVVLANLVATVTRYIALSAWVFPAPRPAPE